MILIETKRLLLREFEIGDIPRIIQYSKEETKQKELPDEIFDTYSKAANQVEMCINNYKEKKYPLVYAMVLKETNTFIGDVLLCPIQDGVEIGYFVSEKYQGNGYATEAIKAFAPWAKDTLHINLVYGLAKESNIGSWKALERAGFLFSHEMEHDFFGKVFTFKVYTYS